MNEEITEEMEGVAPEGMQTVNTAMLGEGAYADKEEGEEVETVVTGRIGTGANGGKILIIETVEGVPVVSGDGEAPMEKPMEEVKEGLMGAIRGNNEKSGMMMEYEEM